MNWALIIATFGSTVLVVGLLIPVLRRAVVDVPNQRSSHKAPTPRGGGLGLLVGAVVASGVAWGQGHVLPAPLVTSLFGLALLGFVDDLVSLRAGVRLLSQLFLSALVSVATLRPDSPWDFALVALATIFIAGYTNSFNFMDGLNGISALVGAVTGGWYMWLGHTVESADTSLLGAVLLSISLAFVPWNAIGQAKIFLGDVGSYLLGGMSAIAALTVWTDGAPWHAAIAPLAIYVADTLWTMLRRIRAGHVVGVAHRDHVYQRLASPGVKHLHVAVYVAVFVSAACLSAYAVGANSILFLLTISALILLYVASPSLVERKESADD